MNLLPTFGEIFVTRGRFWNFGGLPRTPYPKFSIFLFHYLAQRVIHGWKALVLRIPEHFLFFLCDAFWPSYGQKSDSKNVENPQKSPIYGQKSGPI